MGNAAPDGRAPGQSASAEEPAGKDAPANGDAGSRNGHGPAANGQVPVSAQEPGAAESAEPGVTERAAANGRGSSAGSGVTGPVAANGRETLAGSSGVADAAGSGATEPVAANGQGSSAGSGAAEPGVAKVSKAGRDLRAAIAVGVALGAVVLVSLLTIRELFIGVVAAAVVVATIELAGALRRAAKIEVALVPVLVGGQAMLWLSWPFGTNGVFVAFVLTVLACLFWRFRGGSENYLRDVTASIFTLTYVALFATFAALLVEPHDGTARVLCFLIVCVCSDTGGYVAGVLFGKHPMAPSISPKKSWEGLAGSLVAGIVGGALSVYLLLHGHWYLGVPFGIALVITATGGDLVESLIKRDLGIKDMGNLLPGHGGLMDRLDSLLPSAVTAWMLLTLFVPA
jgi:phosphatidate cytidylyltransferase